MKPRKPNGQPDMASGKLAPKPVDPDRLSQSVPLSGAAPHKRASFLKSTWTRSHDLKEGHLSLLRWSQQSQVTGARRQLIVRSSVGR